MATAQVLFQRFYYSKSLVKHDAEVRNYFVLNLLTILETYFSRGISLV